MSEAFLEKIKAAGFKERVGLRALRLDAFRATEERLRVARQTQQAGSPRAIENTGM